MNAPWDYFDVCVKVAERILGDEDEARNVALRVMEETLHDGEHTRAYYVTRTRWRAMTAAKARNSHPLVPLDALREEDEPEGADNAEDLAVLHEAWEKLTPAERRAILSRSGHLADRIARCRARKKLEK